MIFHARSLWRRLVLAGLATISLAACQSSPPDPEPTFTQVRKITLDDSLDYDVLGSSVAFDGSQLLAGTRFDQMSYATSLDGRAHLFSRNTGGTDAWGEVKRFTVSDGFTFEQFGYAVALGGDTGFIGAPQEDDIETNAGAVHVFTRDQGGAGAWGETKRLAASDGAHGDFFGQAISLDGDTALVGAPGNSVAANGGGAVYVFARDQGGPGNWGETAKIMPSDPHDAARFGSSVALAGDIAVIGAYRDGALGSLYGAAYVFYRGGGNPATWQEIKKLAAYDAADWDGFGVSVAVSGDLVIVGADTKHEAGVEEGAAYIFGRNQGGADNWGLIKKLSAADAAPDDAFGTSVSLSGDYVLVGAPGVNGGPVIILGAVYVFRRNLGGADAWGLMGKVTPSDAGENCQFGRSTALAGDLFAVGGPAKPNGGVHRGAVYVFRIDP